jgi:glucosamine kinase
MDSFLGIDAGGTHTRARLVADDGTILGTGEGGPANTPEGVPQAVRAIEDAASQALAAAGLSGEAVGLVRAGLGMAGLSRQGRLKGLREHVFPFASMAIASDAAIANMGAHLGGDGGIVILGTGSVGFGQVGDRVFTIGGYGFPVSDEGSGAELGLRAIRRALWARDGRIPHTEMTRQVLDHFGGSSSEIVDFTGRATPADFGQFAPMVLDHANAGDSAAELIVQESARRIDAIIRTLWERGAPDCCLMGGLAAPMRDWLAANIRSRLREPQGDALDGAIILARRGA